MTLSRTNWTQVKARPRAIEKNKELHRLLGELRDWSVLAGVSLAGWIVFAIAIGIL